MTEPSHSPQSAHSSQVDALLGARPRSRTRRRIGIGLLLLALAAAGVLLLRFMEGNTTPYYMLPLTRGDLHPRLSLAGTVRLPAEVAVSAPWDGVISAAPAALGAVVTAGQTLLYLEDPAIARTLAADRAQIDAARAAAAHAGIAVKASAVRLARFEAVWQESQHRVPSLDEMERARADAARAAVTARRARILLDAAWRKLRDDRARQGTVAVRAPRAGVVVDLVAAPGSWVHARQTVLTLAPEGAAPQVVAPLPAALDMPAPGATAQVQLGGDGAAVRGATLLRVQTDAAGTRRALFALAPGAFVPPGARALVDIKLPTLHHVLLVPDAALAFAHPCAQTHARSSIWLWTADGVARQVAVVIGPGDGRHTQIVSGPVKPGDLAIIGWKAPPRRGSAQPPHTSSQPGAAQPGIVLNAPSRS